MYILFLCMFDFIITKESLDELTHTVDTDPQHTIITIGELIEKDPFSIL